LPHNYAFRIDAFKSTDYKSRMTNDVLRFPRELDHRMREKGTTLTHLATSLDVTYEHVRKIARGLVTPSNDLLGRICDLLQLDHCTMEQLVAADKMRRRYGTVMLELVGKDERTEQLELALDSLTDEQVAFLRAGALYFVRKNRLKHKRMRR
jgi:transcriptional regulator with XRE-family HTH domain